MATTSNDLIEQAENALAGYPGQYANNRERQVALFPELLAEVKRLHSWPGLMSLLDEHYPETIFPTTDDDEYRDSGPRIISLLRRVDQLQRKLEERNATPFGGMYSGGSDV